MIEDKELGRKMEQALIERAKGGPNSDPPVSERKVPRASSLSTGCTRREVYYLTGAPQDEQTAASAAATTTGQEMEDGVLSDLEAALPGNWKRNVRLENDWVRGTADDVQYDGPNGEATLVADSKTANVASWEIKQRQGSTGDEIEAQLQIYMHLTGAGEAVAAFRKTGGNAKDMGKGVYLPIFLPYRHEIVTKMERIAREAMAARDNGTIPARSFSKRDVFPCSYCPYTTHCWAGA